MRLEFEPNVIAFPLVENEVFDDVQISPGLDTLLKRGITAAQNGDRELARELLKKVTDADPQSEDAWMWLASISDYPEELLAILNRVLGINPNNERADEWRAATQSLLAKTFVQRAVAANEEGSHELAAECLDQALAHDNDCESAWIWKASFASNTDERLACLERVLAINPENEDAANAVAAIVRSRSDAAFGEAKAAAAAGKRKKALELVDEFLASQSQNADAWILRSHLAIDLDDKVASLEKALEIDPQNQAARSGYDFLRTALAPVPGPEPQPEPQPAHQEELQPEPQPELESAMEEVPVVYDDLQHAEPVEPEPLCPRSVEELFGPVATSADAESLTVESIPVFEETAEYIAQDTVQETVEERVEDDLQPEPVRTTSACPFCNSDNDAQALECASCHSVLTLSDSESLLANTRAEREVVQNAVTRMEAEWNFREFTEDELIALAIGHFNLRNLGSGLKYLEEASRLNPNNVILAGQVNAFAIRLDEIRRQNEIRDAMPKGKTILVVDDSPTVRKLISGKLEKSGHHVICAGDGIEALECLEVGLPDLVLLDITMPRMDGYEVCKQIRSNPTARDLPVVMISGKDGFFDKVRGRMAGTTGYVTKPFGPETLMKALETYLLPDGGA